MSGDTAVLDTPLHYRLRWAMEVRDIEPEEMADILGMHVNSVHNYLAGRRTPKDAVLRVWAMRVGAPFTFEWLKTGVKPSSGPDDDPVTRTDTGR